MKEYIVLLPVEHDGKRYESGETIKLKDATAKPLLAVNAIAEIAAAPAP